MKRTIRLTESELIKLVGRIIKEQEETETDNEFLSDSFGWFKDAVKKVADLFKREYINEMDEEDLENLKMTANNINVREAISKLPEFASSEEGRDALEIANEKIEIDTISEGYLNEGWLSDNIVKVLVRTGIVSGLGMVVGGLISFISELKGYIDLPEFMVEVHNIVESSGCNTFCGPLAILAMILGVVLALRSAIVMYK